MVDLSPAAQEVLDAMYQVNMDFDGENAQIAAAALRAAADQLRNVYANEEPIDSADDFLYDIATELETYHG